LGEGAGGAGGERRAAGGGRRAAGGDSHIARTGMFGVNSGKKPQKIPARSLRRL